MQQCSPNLLQAIGHTMLKTILKKILSSALLICVINSGMTHAIDFARPLRVLYTYALQASNSREEYQKKLQEFLANYDVQHEVTIYKINNSSFTGQLFFDEDQPALINSVGIWLNEDLLSNLDDVELVFELAYAATTYAKLNIKAKLVRLVALLVPHAALGSVSKKYVDVLKDLSHSGSSGQMVNYAGSLALPWLGHKSFVFNQEQIVRPLIAMIDKTTQSKLVLSTIKMLCDHGYRWIAEEYLHLLKDRIMPDKATVIHGKALTAQEMYSIVDLYLTSQQTEVTK